MGKACVILAFMMLALAIFPKFDANAASIENPLLRSEFEEGPRDLDPSGDVGHDRGGMDYDYAFLNQPPYAGGFPRDLRVMQRHHRLMKRMRRFATPGEKPAFPPNKIPPGCCSCGDHYCCDSQCHGK